VDVDVGSSTTASSVVGLVAGAVKSLVIDMAIVLQARLNCPLSRCPQYKLRVRLQLLALTAVMPKPLLCCTCRAMPTGYVV